MEKIRPELLDLIGGTLCLDFANTKNGHRGMVLHEALFHFQDLTVWSLHAGILTESDVAALLHKANEQPTEAESAFQKAIHLREVIFRIFSAVADEKIPDANDLEILKAFCVEALENSRLIPSRKCFVYGYKDEASLDRVTWSVANSALELLTSEAVDRVRECAGEKCDWLFIDNSRNHLRRWCSMEECGNRAKMRRRYARCKTVPS